LLSFRNAISFDEEGEDGSLRQDTVVHEHDEAVNSADQVRHTDPRLTAKTQLLNCGNETGKDNHVHSLANSLALPDFGKVHGNVLYGRGETIYYHAGNVQFRVWVSEHKTKFFFAPNDETKKSVPGCFLQRDPTHAGWWIEVGDRTVTEKTRKALWGMANTSDIFEKSKDESRKQEEFERPDTRSRFYCNVEAQPPIDETAPARLDDICNAEDQARQSSYDRTETEDGIASVCTQETERIRTPRPHDVLFGQGEAIYYHPGKVQFRVWVSERNASYSLAPNDETKKRIFREVIALVRNQNPPGCFLQLDPTHAGWWIDSRSTI
jgi:hypothetical protein